MTIDDGEDYEKKNDDGVSFTDNQPRAATANDDASRGSKKSN